MPSVTPRQRRFFGAELGRKKKGLATKTGLPIGKLKDFPSSVKEPKAPKEPGTPKTPKMTAGIPKVMKPPKPPTPTPPPGGLGDLAMAVKKPNLTGGY